LKYSVLGGAVWVERFEVERFEVERFEVERFGVERFGVERFEVERFGVERFEVERFEVERFDVERFEVGRFEVGRGLGKGRGAFKMRFIAGYLTKCSSGLPSHQLAHSNVKRGSRLTWR
jgi:hypothetical protein